MGRHASLAFGNFVFFWFAGPSASTFFDLTGLLSISGDTYASALWALARVILSAWPVTSRPLSLSLEVLPDYPGLSQAPTIELPCPIPEHPGSSLVMDLCLYRLGAP